MTDLAEGTSTTLSIGYHNGEQIYFTYTVTSSTGTASASDFFVDFQPGAQTGGLFTFRVFAIGDAVAETDETFSVTASGLFGSSSQPWSFSWDFTIKDVYSPSRDEAIAGAFREAADLFGQPTDENMQDWLEYARSRIIEQREKDPLNTELRDAERYILGVETTGDHSKSDVNWTTFFVIGSPVYEGLKYITGQRSTLMRDQAEIPQSAPGGLGSVWDGFLDGVSDGWKARIVESGGSGNPGTGLPIAPERHAAQDEAGGHILYLRSATAQDHDFVVDGTTYHVAVIADIAAAAPGTPVFDEIGGSYALTDAADTWLVSAPATVALGGGNDVAIFSAAADARGGDGNDLIVLSDEDDRADGGAGDDLAAGNGGDDRLDGATGEDLLDGGDGNDRLAGGAGSDRLRGGEGADLFVFDALPDAEANVDTIEDFTPGSDRIVLDGAFFRIPFDGPLAASAFSASGFAASRAHRILYEAATGSLSYDVDGSGPETGIPFAKLAPNLSLSSAMFEVENALPTIPYRSFDGDLLELTGWSGRHVALLTQSAALDGGVMADLLDALDAAWEVYRTVTGREPAHYLTHDGRLSIAQVPTTFGTAGGALGYLGFTGIELSEPVWQALYGELRDSGRYDQAVFYELGRNFWFYGDQLGKVDPFVTGFAIATRFVSMEVAGLPGAPFHGFDFAQIQASIVDDLGARYFSGASHTLANTLGTGVAPANPFGWGAADLAAAFMYQIYQNFGLADYAAFFQALAARPAAQSQADAFANFIAAATSATGFDFAYLDKSDGAVLPIGNAGSDSLVADGSGRPLLGLGGNDLLTGSPAADRLLGGAGADQLAGGAGDDFLAGGLGDDAIDGGEDGDRLEGGPGRDRLQGGGGNDALLGDEGDDVLDPGPGADSLAGGEGNDGLAFGAWLDGADQVDGGNGTDTVAIQGDYPALTLGAFANVELLLAVSGSDPRFGDTAGNAYDYAVTTQDSNVAAGQTFSVIAIGLLAGEDLHFDGAAESDGHFRIFAGRGVDDLRGGAGSDGFFFGADGNLTAADRVDGGGGIDSLALRGDHVGPRAIHFDDASFANIEVLALLSGHSNEYSGVIVPAGFDYDVTSADGNLAAGALLDVNGVRLGADEQMRFDGRAESDGSFRMLAGAGDDMLFGGGQADLIYGALGADALDGGGGADIYLYRSAADSTLAARDTIAFGAGDRIDLHLIDADSLADGHQGFAFIGSAAFSAAGQLRAWQDGGQWIVEGDVDGNGVADLVIAVTGAAAIGAGDFIF